MKLGKRKKALSRYLISTVKKYGRIKMVFAITREAWSGAYNRERILTKSGSCMVRYNYPDSYTCVDKWSRYDSCCFVEDYTDYYGGSNWRKRLDLKKTVDYMLAHDGNWLKLVEVRSGRAFKKVLKKF